MNFPGPRTRSTATLGLLVVIVALAGQSCSSTQHITQVGERTYRIECEEPLSKCLTQLERTCTQGFKILEGMEKRRTYGVNVGDVINEKHTSRAVAKCRSDALIGGDEEEDESEGQSGALRLRREPTANSAQPPPPVCVAGTTQACIGVGGCAGGQSCQLDGTAFGPCQCAPAPEPQPVPPATAPSPSSTVAPTPTAPASAPTQTPQPAPSSTAPALGSAKPSP